MQFRNRSFSLDQPNRVGAGHSETRAKTDFSKVDTWPRAGASRLSVSRLLRFTSVLLRLRTAVVPSAPLRSSFAPFSLCSVSTPLCFRSAPLPLCSTTPPLRLHSAPSYVRSVPLCSLSCSAPSPFRFLPLCSLIVRHVYLCSVFSPSVPLPSTLPKFHLVHIPPSPPLTVVIIELYP